MDYTDAEPIPGLLLPSGEVTVGARVPSTLRLSNARVACALQLKGKRVLNLGCAWGIHSCYMAATADEVVGIDHSAERIAIAESTRKALGVSNVSFKCGDFRDPLIFDGAAKFDLVIAWGFLHRISDIFALLDVLSPMADALSFEWRAPVLPLMHKLSLAYHPTVGDALNPKNVGPPQRHDGSRYSEKRATGGGNEGQIGFWEPTPGAVSAICRRFGYNHARLLGYGEQFSSGTKTVAREWAVHLAKWMTGKAIFHQIPLTRVHMIVEKSPCSIELKGPLRSNIGFPVWDLALQRSIKASAV